MSGVYYNDHDAFACAWLRELIKAGHLPEGEVDERSILDVEPGDLRSFRQCHFFAGIGGWPYALALAGHGALECWTASLPCQPLSVAGQGRGDADERHLWPAFYRLVAERRPATIVGEQVASKDGREWLAGVRLDLEAAGYACGAANLPACGVGAPHRRERRYWCALEHPGRGRHGVEEEPLRTGRGSVELSGGNGGLADAASQYRQSELKRFHAGDRSDAGPSGDGERTEGGVADAECGRFVSAQEPSPKPSAYSGDDRLSVGSGDGGMGDAEGAGLEGHARDGDDGHKPRWIDPRQDRQTGRAGHHFWSDAEWRVGADGKARRVEPGVRLLAHGIPNRVGRLRGYGNSIVPQVAAMFIEAVVGEPT